MTSRANNSLLNFVTHANAAKLPCSCNLLISCERAASSLIFKVLSTFPPLDSAFMLEYHSSQIQTSAISVEGEAGSGDFLNCTRSVAWFGITLVALRTITPEL